MIFMQLVIFEVYSSKCFLWLGPYGDSFGHPELLISDLLTVVVGVTVMFPSAYVTSKELPVILRYIYLLSPYFNG